jgi:hypothetical protein
MRNNDAPADDERDVERVVQLSIGVPGGDALDQVIVNAIVTAQNGGRDQAKQFFRLAGQRAIVVRHRVEIEKAFDAKMIARQNFFIHLFAVRAKVVQTG